MAKLNLGNAIDNHVLALHEGFCHMQVRGFGRLELSEDDTAFIDLIDAGDLRLDTGGAAYRLTRRAYPDIFLEVTGVTYQGIFSVARDQWEESPVKITGRGSLDVGEFSDELTVPPVPRLLEVGGAPVTGEYASLDWEGDLVVRWYSGSHDSAEPLASVFVEFAVVELERRASLHCRTRDTGLMVLPRATLSELRRHTGDNATVRMIIRRISSDDFSAAGVDAGEIHLISQDAVLLQ
jgi:hypothetical protein